MTKLKVGDIVKALTYDCLAEVVEATENGKTVVVKLEGREKKIPFTQIDTGGYPGLILVNNIVKSKPIHAKPSLYAYYFYDLKEIAKKYGYNLVLHGSMNRDLDLILIPWDKKILDDPAFIESEWVEELVFEMAEHLGGHVLDHGHDIYTNDMGLGRKGYVINLNRQRSYDESKPDGGKIGLDPQYYIDISITPIGY